MRTGTRTRGRKLKTSTSGADCCAAPARESQGVVGRRVERAAGPRRVQLEVGEAVLLDRELGAQAVDRTKGQLTAPVSREARCSVDQAQDHRGGESLHSVSVFEDQSRAGGPTP